MADLIVRPSGLPHPHNWTLQLRYHESYGPTDDIIIARIDRQTAIDIFNAGNCRVLMQHPLSHDTEATSPVVK